MASKFKIGQEVIVNTKEIPQKKGVIRFVGKIEGKTDEYVGVELDQPAGKNNGDHEGKSYFKIEKKSDKGLFGVFVKPASVKLVEGKKTAPTGVPARPSKAPQPPPPAQGKTKLSNELFEQQNTQMQALKEQLEAAYEKIRTYEELDTIKEVESLRGKIKQLQEIIRGLKLDVEKARYRSDSAGEERLKELGERLAYFQNLKEAAQKDRADLRKKVTALQEELQAGAETEQMLETLTYNNQQLEAKVAKLKSENENLNAQLKSAVMLGNGSSNEQLEQSITTLNEMVTMLEGQLQEEKQKVANYQKQIGDNAVRLSELVTLQRQLKSRNDEVQAMRQQLEALSDTATFAQNLVMASTRKDEEIQQQSKRLKQFALKVNQLQTENAQSQEVIELQSQEMEHLEDEVARHISEKEEKVKNIQQLSDQIQKYKQKIKQLSQTHSSIQFMDDKDEQSLIKNYFNTDLYQHKYYQLSRLHQITQSRFLHHQLQSSTIKQYSGTLLANLFQTLPQNFTSRFHPHLLNLLLSISSATYKLYLLFDTVSSNLIHKSQLYSAEHQNLAGWMLMLLDQIPMLYGSLLKVEFAILSADGEEDLKDILSNNDLREQTVRVDIFAHELLERFASQTLDTQIGFDPFIESVEVFDKACEAVKRLPTELAIRLELSVEGMRGVHQILYSIELYHRNSQARQNAQVDTMLQNFLKLLHQYLRECCTNPHVRLKSEMRSYLSGVDFVVKILKEIELNDTLQQLNSLYSDVQDIKILKETVLTTQFHLKQLTADLQQISYTTSLSRVHVKLPGKLWQQKIRQMRDQLARFQTTTAEKVELERVGAEQKRKILLLEKEIKDRQATKDLHQRRIGQLQLKVEQASLMQGEFKRQSDKLRNVQQERKLVEDQLNNQIKRRKQIQEQLKKTKQKFDLFQTESVMKQKKQKVGNSLSSEDLSNLSIFKSVVAEAGALKNHQIRRQLHELAFSPILAQKKNVISHQNARREVLNGLAELKFGESTHHIESQLRSAEFKTKPVVLQEFSVGTLLLRSNKAQLSVDINRREIVGY